MSSDHTPQPEKLISHLVQEDPELRDVVEEFVQTLEGRLTELEQAYEKLDWDLLTTLAHRLRGAGGSYGYPDISRVCGEMEASFKTHQASDFGAWLTQLSGLVAAANAGLADEA